MSIKFKIGLHPKGRAFYAEASQELEAIWLKARQEAAAVGVRLNLQTQGANSKIKQHLLKAWQSTDVHHWLVNWPLGTWVETAICTFDRDVLRMGVVIGITEGQVRSRFQERFLGVTVQASFVTSDNIVRKADNYSPGILRKAKENVDSLQL